MTNSLAIYQQFDQIKGAAMALQKSGYFSDVASEAQAIVKVMAGAELGLPPFAAMTGIHIIKGKPVLGANVLATLIKNDPRYDYRVVEHTDKICSIDFYENGEKVGNSVFTAEDAQRIGSQNMQKYPKNMLFARAISNGAKWYTPGVFGGAPVYTPDEFGMDVDDDGDPVIVDAKIVDVTTPTPEPVWNPEHGADVRMYKSTIKQAIVDNGFADNIPNAAAMLDHSKLPSDVTAAVAVAWARNYRTARADGKTTPEAAELANSAYQDYIDANS